MKKIRLTLKYKLLIGAGCSLALLFAGLYAYWTPKPRLIVLNQTIQNGQITIKQINLPFDGWVLLSATKYEQPTEMIGKIRIERGRNKNVGVYVNVLKTTPRVEAAVYEDKTTPGIFDLNTDKEVIVGVQPLKMIFNKQ